MASRTDRKPIVIELDEDEYGYVVAGLYELCRRLPKGLPDVLDDVDDILRSLGEIE